MGMVGVDGGGSGGKVGVWEAVAKLVMVVVVVVVDHDALALLTQCGVVDAMVCFVIHSCASTYGH